MMWLKRKIGSLMRRPLAVTVLALGIAGTAVTAGASTTAPPVTWTTEADFEYNVSTMPVPTPTTLTNVDTTTTPGDAKIGFRKDFVTTATITCATSSNKIYTTGVDRNSIAVVDAATKAVTTTILLTGRAAGRASCRERV